MRDITLRDLTIVGSGANYSWEIAWDNGPTGPSAEGYQSNYIMTAMQQGQVGLTLSLTSNFVVVHLELIVLQFTSNCVMLRPGLSRERDGHHHRRLRPPRGRAVRRLDAGLGAEQHHHREPHQGERLLLGLYVGLLPRQLLGGPSPPVRRRRGDARWRW